MGTLRFDGVWFAIYSHDHPPPHAHGIYGKIPVIVDFDSSTRGVTQSTRKNAIQPSNASRADVKHILTIATAHYDELKSMWEATHG